MTEHYRPPTSPQSFWCSLGLHKREYRVHVEHGIIDGPPRSFARVTCARCGESFVSRDPAHCERAERAERERQ